MAVTGLYYQLAVKNAEKNEITQTLDPQTIYVRIYDLTLEDETTTTHQIVNITGSGDPFRLATVDNSEDKFTGVKPIQATIKFLSSGTVKLSSFVNAEIPPDGVDVGDPRWRVEAYYNSYTPENIIFKGFVNLDDCYEAFLPEKNEVVLVANDGLGGLKNIPLTDFGGNNPIYYNRIADYLAWALSKTGLSLPIKCVFNIREKSQPDDHFFDVMYENAKTFENTIGVSINCYDVIERILGEEAFLTQRNGEWWIIRVDELCAITPSYLAVYNADGTLNTLDAIGTDRYYPKFIGSAERIFFSQEATTVHPVRPYKFIKESYSYDFPQEIVDNIDFSRGQFQNFNSGTLIARYDIANWISLETPTGAFTGLGTPSTTAAYIQRLFADTNMTYEKERYVVIEAHSPAKGFFIKSSRVYVHKNDKFDISVDSRFSVDTFPSSGSYRLTTMQVRLTGDDGSFWTLSGGETGQNPYWFITSGSFATPRDFVIEGNFTEDMHDWKTCSFISDSKDANPCPPIPVDGFIEILLLHGTNANSTDRHFSNLRFTYIPYINGSYSKYNGQYYKISRDVNLVNTREKQVYISDGIKKLYKGALHKFSSWQTFVSSQTAFVPADKKIVLATTAGDVRGLFPVGGKFNIAGTTNNNGVFSVKSTEFTAGSTIIYVNETIATEGGLPTASYQRGNFGLANEFFSWNDYPVPDDLTTHPYAQIQAYDVWNQYRSGYNSLRFTAQGLDGAGVDMDGYINHPHLLHTYYLHYGDESVDSRQFMLLSFDIDFYTCEWTGTLAEVHNSYLGKFYDDNLEIKFE